MNYPRVVVGLALVIACLAVWACGQLVAQPQMDLPPPTPPTPLSKPAGDVPVRELPPSYPTPPSTPTLKGPTPSAAEPAVDAASGPASDNTTGRQEPAVSLEWVGPPVTSLTSPLAREAAAAAAGRSPVRRAAARRIIAAASRPAAS